MAENDVEIKIRAALEGAAEVVGFSSQLGKLGVDSDKAAVAARNLDAALDELAKMQEQIQRSRELQASLNAVSAAMESAQQRQRGLTAEVVASLGASQRQITEQARANTEVTKAESALAKARDAQKRLTDQVIAASAPSDQLLHRHDESTRTLARLIDRLAAARDRQREANTAVAAGSEPSAQLQKQHEAATQSVEKLAKKQSELRGRLDQVNQSLAASGIKAGQFEQASAQIGQTFTQVTADIKRFAEAQAKLSFVPHEQLEREAQALKHSYDVLKSSGKLTAQELAQANLKLNEGLLDLERRTNGWKDSLIKAKVEIGATFAAFLPIAKTIKDAAAFESALAGVRKVVDGTDDQFAALTARIKELSHETPISAEGLASIAAAGGQLGVPIEKLDQFINLSTRLGVAFNLSADQAGQAVAKLGNVFGIPLERVGQLGDAINVLGNTTAATEAGIVEFLTRVGGSAKQFGLTAESVSALGASLISMGRTPEVAATAINSLLLKLQGANVLAPTAKNALNELGLEATVLARLIQENPQAALEKFLGTLQQLDGQARTEALAQILGLEHADEIASLIGNLDQYQTALSNATNAQQTAGALEREFQTQRQTTINQYQELKNVVNGVSETLGSAFLPFVQAAIAAGKTLAEAIAAIVEAAPGLVALAGTVGTLAIGFSGMKLATAAARVALTGMFETLRGGVNTLQAVTAATTTATVATERFAVVMKSLPQLLAIGLVLTGISEAISAFSEIREGQRRVAAAQDEVNAKLSEGINQARDRLSQYSAAAAGVEGALLTVSNGVASLTGAQLSYYKNLLTGAEQYLLAQNAIALREKEQTGQTEINQTEVLNKLKEVRDALGLVAAAHDAGGAAAQSASAQTITALTNAGLDIQVVKARAGELESAFESAGEGGSNSVEAISKALKEVDLSAQTGVQGALLALENLSVQGDVTSDQIRTGLGEAFSQISDVDLVRVGAVATQFYTALGDGAVNSGVVLDSVLREQFRRLGLDIDDVSGRVGAAAAGMIANFTSIATSANVTGEQLTAAFTAALAKLDTPQELESLKTSLEGVKVKGFDAAGGIAQINQKIVELQNQADPALKAVNDAFATLGVTSSATLQQTAQQAQTAFDTIVAAAANGKASTGDVDAAFTALAQKEIAAGVAAGEYGIQTAAANLKAAATTQEQVAQVDALVAKQIAANTAVATSAQSAADAQTPVQEKIQETGDKAIETVGKVGQATVTTGDALAQFVNRIFGQVHEELANTSLEAVQAFEKIQFGMEKTASPAQGFNQQLAEIDQQLTDVAHDLGDPFLDPLTKWAAATIGNAREVKKQFIQQQQSVEGVTAALDVLSSGGSLDDVRSKFAGLGITFDNFGIQTSGWIHTMNDGRSSLVDFIRAGEQALAGMTLLDRQQLGGLQSAIDRARGKLADFRDEVSDLQADLNAELAGLDGRLAESEAIKRGQQRQELEERLRASQLIGDTESTQKTQQALTTFDAITNRRVNEAREREQQNRERDRPPERIPETRVEPPPRTITVNIKTEDGRTRPITVQSQDDADKLIDTLQRLKGRTQ